MSSYDIRVKWFGLLHHQHQERYQVLQESILEENSLLQSQRDCCLAIWKYLTD